MGSWFMRKRVVCRSRVWCFSHLKRLRKMILRSQYLLSFHLPGRGSPMSARPQLTSKLTWSTMYTYFDRDNVALKGLSKFFKESSEEEREHAEKLMDYQNKRGGRVKLHTILSPPSEFDHVEKGDALYAMELALSLEKLTNEKLLNLHSVADQNNDPQLADFIESEYLEEQVEAIKKIADYVTQLRMVGKGHGVWHFDQKLLHEGNGAV